MMSSLPNSARLWQYRATTGGLENNLQIKTLPIPTPKPDQHLIRVISTAVNAVDYKIAEIFPIGALAISKPATPGMDIAGEIVIPATGSKLAPGTLVLGSPDGNIFAAGGFAEYVVAAREGVTPIPKGVSITDAASLPCSSMTAYQCIAPNTKPGDRILFNGGSGGVGLIAIQVAKALGRHITVTCSTRNVELCRSYGADEIIDYTQAPLLSTLQRAGQEKFDLVIDGVGNDHALYWGSDRFTNPGAKFLYIAMSPGLKDVRLILLSNILPVFLGGQRTKLVPMSAKLIAEEGMVQAMEWMEQGKLKACIDSKFSFEQLPEAIKKVKTSRARGKVMVDVAPEGR